MYYGSIVMHWRGGAGRWLALACPGEVDESVGQRRRCRRPGDSGQAGTEECDRGGGGAAAAANAVQATT